MSVADELIRELNEYVRYRISDEGEKILRAILARGFVTAKDIETEVLPGIASSALYRSAKRLYARDLVEPLRMTDVGTLGWRLSRDLQKRFCEQIGFSGSGPYRLQATRDLHDRVVRKVAYRLQEQYAPHFIAHEGMVRSHLLTAKIAEYSDLKNLVPDLVLGSKKENGEVLGTAVEIELSQKGLRRRQSLFDKKLSCREWANVLYFLGPHTDLYDHVSAARFAIKVSPRITRDRPFNPILFVSIEAFQKEGLEAKGRLIRGEKTIREFLSETGREGDVYDAENWSM